jgi:resuscitation-promoting factor RpfB
VLENPILVKLQTAKSISIDVDGKSVRSLTSAQIVGSALSEAGIALEGLDRCLPAEDQYIPSDGNIQVTRVREEFLLEQTTLPFTTEYVADPNTELDQQSVAEDGQYGLQVSRQRVRFENGIEVSRQTESQWIASDPKPKKIGYGTKVVVRTLDTPAGRIEYWRAITVYATAYSPCRSGTTKCYYGTSLGLPVQRGVIGVTRAWYNLMAGQGVYVPGYGKGIIADTGGGIPGKRWIDLGFTDEEFEAWHQDVTLYFLTPIPADIPWILP